MYCPKCKKIGERREYGLNYGMQIIAINFVCFKCGTEFSVKRKDVSDFVGKK